MTGPQDGRNASRVLRAIRVLDQPNAAGHRMEGSRALLNEKTEREQDQERGKNDSTMERAAIAFARGSGQGHPYEAASALKRNSCTVASSIVFPRFDVAVACVAKATDGRYSGGDGYRERNSRGPADRRDDLGDDRHGSRE